MKIGGWGDAAEAKKLIREAVERHEGASEAETDKTPVGQENADEQTP